MKRTKSMIYRWSDDANDIYLSLVNEGELYRTRTIAIIENLKKKANKGIYNSEKAIDIYYSLVNEYLERFYYKESGVLPVQVRFTVAVALEERYREHVFEEVAQ